MIAIRGAVFVDANTNEDIYIQTQAVLKKIINTNEVSIDQIISVMFSTTKDLNQAYPAVAARKMGLVHAALFCTQEMFVENSAKMCIRIMMHVESDRPQAEAKHVYMNGAEKLRPDLQN